MNKADFPLVGIVLATLSLITLIYMIWVAVTTWVIMRWLLAVGAVVGVVAWGWSINSNLGAVLLVIPIALLTWGSVKTQRY